MRCMRMRVTSTAVLLLLVGVLGPAESFSQVTIDFDGLVGMVNVPGTVVPEASRLSTELHASTGAVFSSGPNSFAAVVNVVGLPSDPNGIGGVDAQERLDYVAPITIAFFDPTDIGRPATTDFVSITSDTVPLGSGTFTLTAFDAAGVLLGTTTTPDDVGGKTISVSFPGIHSVEVSGTTGTVAFDNLTFNDIAAAVPLLSNWALGLLALGLVAAGAWLGRPGALVPALDRRGDL